MKIAQNPKERNLQTQSPWALGGTDSGEDMERERAEH